MNKFEDIRDLIADKSDEAVFVHSRAEAETIAPRFESGEFEGEIWILTDLTSDHNFHSPRVDYAIGEAYFSGEHALVTLGDDSPSLDCGDEDECLLAFIDDLGPSHPQRTTRAVLDYLEAHPEVELHIGEQRLTPGHEYRLVASAPEDDMGVPSTVIAAVYLEDCSGVVAARDCSRGQDDHEYLYEVKAGPHAGMYLREYASRWQWSPDYECSLVSKARAVKLATTWGDHIGEA